MGKPIHSILHNKEIVVATKSTNIRSLIGSHFPTFNHGQVIQLINTIASKKNVTVKDSSNNDVVITKVNSASYTILGLTYMYADLKNVLRETEAIIALTGSKTGNLVRFIFDDKAKANKSLNPKMAAQIYGSVVRRFYNWNRPDADRELIVKVPKTKNQFVITELEKSTRVSPEYSLDGIRFKATLEIVNEESTVFYIFIPTLIVKDTVKEEKPFVEKVNEPLVKETIKKKSFFTTVINKIGLGKIFA